jgi:hypothetical protein
MGFWLLFFAAAAVGIKDWFFEPENPDCSLSKILLDGILKTGLLSNGVKCLVLVLLLTSFEN